MFKRSKVKKSPSEYSAESEGFHMVVSKDSVNRCFTLEPTDKYCSNFVSHRKYTILNLIPKFLYDQFKFFFNFFYLIITLTQFIPVYRIGFLVTYVFPLIFVLTISFAKEMFDEFNRWRRDKELNEQRYHRITETGPVPILSQDIKVGMVISVNAGERVPADLILLKTSDDIGSAFIKTTQLDGETDWKLRRSIPFTQSSSNIFEFRDTLYFEVEAPRAEIYDFSGAIRNGVSIQPITVENTVWAETSVTLGSIIGVVVYTGKETRSAMNGAPPEVKSSKIDKEINKYSSFLFVLLFFASIVATSLNGFSSNFHVLLVRFLLLFSFIIPISMRINLDTSKMVYTYRISHDKSIPGAIMRNSTLPEELGRIEYLFTDKTGTLTKNEMEFKKLQVDNISLTEQSNITEDYFQTVLALAICHSVTVTHEGLQSSSPDEIALVKQAAIYGFKLVSTDENSMSIQMPDGKEEVFRIHATLPFSSVWRHMGIVVSNEKYGTVLFCKGADSSIAKMCPPSEWLEEVVGNLAREGLRTLVFACKVLEQAELNNFIEEFQVATTSVVERGQKILEVFDKYSKNMNLLGVSGVEDKLQDNVPETLEALAAANVKVWMLTGDKLETAICVALSSRLFSRETDYKVIKTFSEIGEVLSNTKQSVPPLVVDGSALQQALDTFPQMFLSVATKAPAVVVCRCSPSQKESVVKSVTNAVTCAVGDGGNDVSMIQAASVGIGIVGKEGKQASLSADVSINSFCHIQRLLLWHGTNCYKHSSRLAQFVMHRGVIMTTTQAIYSLMFNVVPSPLYNDWLMMGFATFFTNFAVLALIFDAFIEDSTVLAYPELYTKCQKGRYLSGKTFIRWILIGIYQGSSIIFMSVAFFGLCGRDTRHLQSIAFTALIMTELALIGMDIKIWNLISFLAELFSVLMYFLSIFILKDAFDIYFIFSLDFIAKLLCISCVCILPLAIYEYVKSVISPAYEEQLRDGVLINDNTHLFIL